jgi:cell division septation protein DedD
MRFRKIYLSVFLSAICLGAHPSFSNTITINITGFVEDTDWQEIPHCKLIYEIENNAMGTIHRLGVDVHAWTDREEQLTSSLSNWSHTSLLPIARGETESFRQLSGLESRCEYLERLQIYNVEPQYCNIRMLPEDADCLGMITLTSSIEGLVVLNSDGQDNIDASRSNLSQVSPIDDFSVDQTDAGHGSVAESSEVTSDESVDSNTAVETEQLDITAESSSANEPVGSPIRYQFDNLYYDDNLSEFSDVASPLGELACLTTSSIFSREFFDAQASGVQFDVFETTFTPIEVDVFDDRIVWTDADIVTPIVGGDDGELYWTGHPYMPFEELSLNVIRTSSDGYLILRAIVGDGVCSWPFVALDLLHERTPEASNDTPQQMITDQQPQTLSPATQPSLSSLPQQSQENPEHHLKTDGSDSEEGPTGATPVSPIAFFIQVGAFGSYENLLQSQELLMSNDLETQTEEIVVNGRSLTRLLVVGRALDNQSDILRKVRNVGFSDAFVR